MLLCVVGGAAVLCAVRNVDWLVGLGKAVVAGGTCPL